MFCPGSALVARQFGCRDDYASWRGAFPPRLENKRQFVVNWTSCARLVSSRALTENLRPGLLLAEVPRLTSRDAKTPVFPQQKRRTTRSVDHELAFRFPEDTLDFKFRKVQLLMPSNFGKVQYRIILKFEKVYSIELAAHQSFAV